MRGKRVGDEERKGAEDGGVYGGYPVRCRFIGLGDLTCRSSVFSILAPGLFLEIAGFRQVGSWTWCW